ncbi:sphingosine kinase 2-like isoform X2 [Musa acuminata AAA Group]|uniref:sphingosine kinase 2-like isoform X2 n=1 Tax=Musa acuminata AAA Group TaxID=214697 RepID=UPI0031DA80FC
MADKTETSVPTLTERVRIDGAPAKASLAADGTLRWSSGEGGERCLALESEGLGLDVVGRRITIRAFVGALKGLSSCGGRRGAGKRVRRDHVLEMPTEELASRWSERMRAYIDSLDHWELLPLFLRNIFEVVNGLLHREDWDTAIQVPLGVIPAGTGNGMAKSLLDAAGEVYSVSNATFSIIRGYRRTLDVVTISQEKTKFFSVLMLTWGLVADIDIESEKYRWMGSARLDFYSLLRIINLRKYDGHVQFVPAPGYEAYGEPINQTNCCSSNTMLYKDDQGDEANVRPCGYQGPSISLDGCEWRSIDGPFISVWINNVPWASEDIMPAPNAKFSDGYLDAVIIKECPKSALLSLMLKMSDGSYCKSPYVVYLKVKAFRLEPGKQVGHPTKGGIIDSDGEVIARGDDLHCEDQQQNLMMAYGPPIQMTVDQGLATIFSPR